jgi:hypothetical protein
MHFDSNGRYKYVHNLKIYIFKKSFIKNIGSNHVDISAVRV